MTPVVIREILVCPIRALWFGFVGVLQLAFYNNPDWANYERRRSNGLIES